jgi:hypothetical protein
MADPSTNGGRASSPGRIGFWAAILASALIGVAHFADLGGVARLRLPAPNALVRSTGTRRASMIVAIVVVVVVMVGLAGCAQGPSAAEQKARCFANETLIEGEMKLFKADSGLDAPLSDVLRATHAVCPSGGTYSYDVATGRATCSVHGHP